MRFCFIKKEFVEHHIAPNKLAVVDNQRELSWIQFEKEVLAVCDYFKERNWDKLSHPVIIYGHKQAEMIITMYAMMRLKKAYIPIDIIYPKQRIETIQRIAQADVILNCSTDLLHIENTIEVQISKNEYISHHEKEPALTDVVLSSDPLVYIIFTSGSTGEPKGVQITSAAIQTFTQWMINDFGFTPEDIFINIAIFSFDLSVYEVMSFGAIGATLLLNDVVTTKNSDLLMQRIEKYKGTILVSTPSFALAYTRIGADPRLNSIKYFLFCGETLTHTLAASLHKIFSSAHIYNTYGPTEATVATTKVEITKEILDLYNPLPVGYMKPGSEILIDKESREDKEGEIVIVGDNVSIGYFNNVTLNKQKFFIHGDKRAFRTGDIGYYENGMVFCKGRNDDQVKMHGFRIELDEISNVISKSGFVSSAVTVGLKRNNEVKKIISFVIPKNEFEKEDLKNQLIKFLEEKLPFYMIPGDIDLVNDFPYNSSHKIDKKKLIEEYLKRQLDIA